VIDSVIIKVRDSLYVNLLSVDTGVCQGESVRLRVSGDTSFHYSWLPATNVASPSDSNTTARPDTTTTYVVTASFKSCPDVKRSFTATVEPIPIVDIVTPDQVICLAQPLLLQANVGPAWFTNYSYSWSPGTYLTDPNIRQPYFFTQLNQDNRYQLTVTTPLGCAGSDTLHIFTHPPLVMHDVSPDQVIRYGDSVRVQAEGAYYYTWTPTTYVSEPNTYNPNVYPVEPTVFTVVGMNEYGCRDTAYVKIGIDYTTYQFVPSAFTPNGDGLNDVFRMGNMKYLRLQEFRVFNRWGQQVFSTEDPQTGWDGKFNGVDQPTGVYGYMIKVAIPDGSTRFYKGDVTLMR
jgi:gliding motility-associated-like protein